MIKKSKKHLQRRITLFFMRQIPQKMVADYITRGICFDYQTEELQGILVLLPTHPRTLEIVNIAVSEESRGRGIGQDYYILPLILPKRKV